MAGSSDGAPSSSSFPSSSSSSSFLGAKKLPKYRSLVHCYSPQAPSSSSSFLHLSSQRMAPGLGFQNANVGNGKIKLGFETASSGLRISAQKEGKMNCGTAKRFRRDGELDRAVLENGGEREQGLDVDRLGFEGICGEDGVKVAKKPRGIRRFAGHAKMKAMEMLNEELNNQDKGLSAERAQSTQKKQKTLTSVNQKDQKRKHSSSDSERTLSDDCSKVCKISTDVFFACHNALDRNVINAWESSSLGIETASNSLKRCSRMEMAKQTKQKTSVRPNTIYFNEGDSCLIRRDAGSSLTIGKAEQGIVYTSHIEDLAKFEERFSLEMANHKRKPTRKPLQSLVSANCHNVVNEEAFSHRYTKSFSSQDTPKNGQYEESLSSEKSNKQNRCHVRLKNYGCRKGPPHFSLPISESNVSWLRQEGDAKLVSNTGSLKCIAQSQTSKKKDSIEKPEMEKEFEVCKQQEIHGDRSVYRIMPLSDSACLRHHENATNLFDDHKNTEVKSTIQRENAFKSADNSSGLKIVRSKKPQSLKSKMERVLRKCAALVLGSGVLRENKRIVRKSFAFKESAQRIATLLPQKPLQLKWREVHIGLADPTILVSFRCKVYWPKDDEWYTGFISQYNKHTKKHRIIYDDEEEEWLFLLKERIALHISLHDKVALALGSKDQVRKDTKRKQDFEELAVLAASMEDFQGDYHHGDIVWSEIKGYPMWPAFVMDEEHALAYGLERASAASLLPVQFFGSHDCARISPHQMVIFSKGLLSNYHSMCKRVAFRQGLEEVERYFKDRKLPRSMATLQEEVSGCILGQGNFRNLAEQNDDEDFVGDERKYRIKKSIRTLFTCPIVLGSLCVLNLGKIVKDSEYFHDHKYIWTEGYTAIRKFPSMKDPSEVVNYRMEILRSPTMRSLPAFRVTPDDGDPVEGSSASACWKRIFEKVNKGKCNSLATTNARMQRRRSPLYRSGPFMFGFANTQVSRLIQALPGARACSKFMAWSENVPCDETEEVLPAGFKPVEVHWKHLDRCSVCYTNEEYEGNALLQCDKCRMLVHLDCYGVLETSDSDLSLCKLCRPGAPKQSPPCSLCPIKGGAMKQTTDGRWVHLACALWIPETCFVDAKRMEPVDGLRSINRERWKLICSICKVPYGVCIQCAEHHCRVAYHPLCARAAGFHTEVFTGSKRRQNESAGQLDENLSCLRLLSYCRRHRQPREEGNIFERTTQQALLVQFDEGLHFLRNPTGCARCEPYNATARRGRREPEAHSAALARRSFVENRPYIVSGCLRNSYKTNTLSDVSLSASPEQHDSECPRNVDKLLLSRQLNEAHPSSSVQEEIPEIVLSISARFSRMWSTVHQRLTFGKSGIHGWGLFTKQPHAAGDMVIEYAGEIVRPVIADIREKNCYDLLVGAGTYMFCIDEDRVIDATRSGSIAHLINHSCEPNCYSRVISACGKDRIIIFAKRDIPEYEELTYDYRFTSIGEQLTCHCGCPGCRGIVNLMDDEDTGRILVSYTELSPWPPQYLEPMESTMKERDKQDWSEKCKVSEFAVNEQMEVYRLQATETTPS